ncbi:MAG: hypothetical protein RIC19_10915 [Phaeodactylibacter sp.]|uniref:hypothetical protein n=1 Tax=Phaeodactylibacter sp. TaxID=1940289 RepID=UPI0032EF27A3
MSDKTGDQKDLGFLGEQAGWLKKCLVTHKIKEEKGRFWVVMVFTDRDDPLKKLVRPINDYPSRQKAEWHANIFQRQISADPRDPRPKEQPDANDIRRN